MSKKKKTQAEEFAWFARQMVKTMRTMTNILAIMSLIVLIALLKG